jgi:uncharacterized protein with LGFP repeats
LYANDAKSLSVLWNNGEWQTALAKFAAPTVADGKVVLPSEGLFQVYGLSGFPMRMRNLPYPIAIRYKWLNSGGAYGMLGKPISDTTRDIGGGAHQDFAKLVQGGGYGQVSVPPSVKTLHPAEKLRGEVRPVRIVSSIYVSRAYGPHFVVGEIRRLWLALGGLAKLGYPKTDEIPSPDGFGLMTEFQHGTITWHRGQSARVAKLSTFDTPNMR